MPHYGDYQNEIYGGGLQGVLPQLPVDFAGLEARVASALPPSVLSYVQGGCGDEWTQRHNALAFRRWGIVPRMMVDCSTRDLSVELFGVRYPTPLFMSPVGVLGICTQDGHGDLGAAQASVATGVPFVASTLSNDPLEKVAATLGGTPGFFQLYTPKDSRQYFQIRVYAPRHWLLAAATTTLPVFGWTVAMPAALGGDRLAIGALILAFGLHQWRAGLRGQIARSVCGERRGAARLTLFDRWAAPAWLLFHAAIIWSTLFGRTISWSGRTYWVDGPQRLRIIAEPAARSPAP